MTSPQTTNGFRELRSARRAVSVLLWTIALFSAFVNLLMLTGPMFMLQVYDRVLVSRSEETLLALGLLVTFLFLMMGLLDFARGRVATRIAGRFQSRLDRRVFSAVLRRAAVHHAPGTPSGGLRDLGAVHRFIGSPVMLAFFDIPWTPIFLAGITVFHPWLGILAMSGGGILILMTALNQLESRNVARRATGTALHSERLADRLGNEAEAVQSLGMQRNAFERWHRARGAALEAGISASDVSGRYTTMSRSFRLFLQSSMLGLGAWLVLQDQLTPGAMIAASILLGRALAPVDLMIAQ